MSVRNDFSQVSAVSPTASALTLQTMVSMPPSSAAAPSIQPFSASGSATSTALPHDLTPFADRPFTTLPTSSALRAQIATLAPSVANSSAIANPMPLLPPVTSALFPFNPRSMVASVAGAAACSCRQAAAVRLHLLPVARALERRGGPIDRRLLEMLTHQHQADWQPVAHAAGKRHRRMTGGIEWRGIRNHLESALQVEGPRRVRRRQRGRLHRQSRHQQQIVFGERLIVGGPQLAAEIL